MQTVIIVVVVLAVIIAAVLGFAAAKPDTFRVYRTASIKAPPENIFPLINDFHRWSSWSPYEKLDPTMKRTYSGAKSGKGSVYAWKGNNKAGEGRMEITDISDPSRVTIKLDFFKPFEAHNTAEFTMEGKGDSTEVTWAMFGDSPFMMKVMSMFFSMDKMAGNDFETGLANLKAVAEEPVAVASA
jgi:uncharacterized protein YndB with AHSA1/START domain